MTDYKDDDMAVSLALHRLADKHSSSNFIETLEKSANEYLRSQASELPTDIVNGNAQDLEKMGIVIGPLSQDPLFHSVVLPKGWKMVPAASNPHFWTHLLDEKDRQRASIFYKAAPYDRRATIHLERFYDYFSGNSFRFRVSKNATNEPYNVPGDGDGVVAKKASHGWTEVYRVRCTVPTPESSHSLSLMDKIKYQNAANNALEQAKAWLKEMYPCYEDPSAYWNDEPEGT